MKTNTKMATVFTRTHGQDDNSYSIFEGQKVGLLINGYEGTYIVKRIFKNGAISFAGAHMTTRVHKFEPNSDGKVFLQLRWK